MTTKVLAPNYNPPSLFNNEQIELLKDTVCRGATDQELALFIEVCKRKNLDPFSKQIHAVKRWDSQLRRENMTFQTGIDGFRLIAQRSNGYAGQDEPLWCGEDAQWVDVWLGDDPPLAAKVGVYRNGFVKPMIRTALYREYVQVTKEGHANSMWKKMPANQLAKCAEALALRAAFPEELSGLYTNDEMGQADNTQTQDRKAAQADVLKAKLAEFDKEPPLPPDQKFNPPPKIDEPIPDAVQQLWDNFEACEGFDRLKLFGEMKELVGEKNYYESLKKFGFEKANKIKGTGAADSVRIAKLILFDMWKRAKAANEAIGEPFVASDEDVPR